MVELLPVQQFDPQEGNYWGYMTLNFFAPHRRLRGDRTPGPLATNSVRWSGACTPRTSSRFSTSSTTTRRGRPDGPTYTYLGGIDNVAFYVMSAARLAGDVPRRRGLRQRAPCRHLATGAR